MAPRTSGFRQSAFRPALIRISPRTQFRIRDSLNREAGSRRFRLLLAYRPRDLF
jgi:hypothetical protein